MVVAVETIDLLDQERIQREDARRCKRSFAYFLRQAWPVLEPATPFIPGRHIDAMCEHLQAVADGQIRKLLINIAPGYGKSTIGSVAFPAWIWTRAPHERFLCASYALDLAIRDNRNCRVLIESEWYQSLFGDVFALAGDQNVKSFFETDKRGYRLAIGVRSSGTGKRGSILQIDDPNNAMAGKADIEATTEWFGKTWVPRLNDPEHGVMIVIGQRLHQQDLSGHILEQGGWEHLNLPAEYEPGRKCYTSIWEDKREKEGELLWEARFNHETLSRLKSQIGSMAYAAQYQQTPAPSGGGQFKREWFRYFTQTDEAYILEQPDGQKSILKSSCSLFGTIDLAISSKQDADYTVIGIWAVTQDKDLLLLDLIRGRFDNPEQLRQMQLAYFKWQVSYFKVETVAYQLAMLQQALRAGIPCREYKPVRDKVSRASTPAIWFENGKMYFSKTLACLSDVESELLFFPKAAHDDIVDVVTMAAEEVVTPRIPLSGYTPEVKEVKVPTIAELAKTDPFRYAAEHGMWGDDRW